MIAISPLSDGVRKYYEPHIGARLAVRMCAYVRLLVRWCERAFVMFVFVYVLVRACVSVVCTFEIYKNVTPVASMSRESVICLVNRYFFIVCRCCFLV